MDKLKRILASTDFSSHAVAALQHAVVLGSHYKAEIGRRSCRYTSNASIIDHRAR